MKGITPIIAIIILLLITIALAGVAWTFFQGYLYSMMAGSIAIPTGGAYCSNGRITVQLLNTGQSNITNSDITIARIDGTPISLKTFVIIPGRANITIDDDNNGTGWSSGPHTIDIGTAAMVLHTSVYCP